MERNSASLDRQVSTFYTEQRLPVYRHLLLLGLSPAQAQDAAHEAFLALSRTLHDGDTVENWRVWLYRAARNRMSDHQAAGSQPIGSPRCDRLMRAIAALQPQQRECIQLRAAGFGYREIASITGLKHAAVGEALRRAIVHLRKAGL